MVRLRGERRGHIRIALSPPPMRVRRKGSERAGVTWGHARVLLSARLEHSACAWRDKQPMRGDMSDSLILISRRPASYLADLGYVRGVVRSGAITDDAVVLAAVRAGKASHRRTCF